MLHLTFPERENFNPQTNEFIITPSKTIAVEHSLVSVSKWESRWKKPFLSKEPMSMPQVIDYVKCMTLTQNVDPMLYLGLTNDMIKKVMEYIDDPMTATWINEKQSPPNRRIVTSELIYCWMFMNGIPIECQKWHLNRLMMLIRVCNIENNQDGGKNGKLSFKDLAKRNSSLNSARKAAGHTKG